MDNTLYWTQVAIAVAQGLGLHRRRATTANLGSSGANEFFCSTQKSGISAASQRLWRRVWWTLFCRDRTLALARGRPFTIRTEDADIEMLTEEDFQEEDAGVACFPYDRREIRVFLHFIDLCEEIGAILQQRSLFSTEHPSSSEEKLACHKALERWYLRLPEWLRWDPLDDEFLPSVLQLYY